MGFWILDFGCESFWAGKRLAERGRKHVEGGRKPAEVSRRPAIIDKMLAKGRRIV